MSEEPDPLRSAFDEVRASVLPSIRPPGAERVTATVRRRRTVRSTIAAVAAVMLAGTGIWVGLARADQDGPPGTVPSPTASPTTSPSPSASPSPNVTIGTSQLPTSHPSGAPPISTGPACVTDGIAEMISNGAQGSQMQFFPVVDGNIPPCPGYEYPVYWATYSLNQDGTGTLYAKGTTYLDADHIRKSIHVRAPATCATVFIGHDWSSTPETLSAYVMGDSFQPAPGLPFWDHKHNLPGVQWDRLQPCPPPAPPATASPSP